MKKLIIPALMVVSINVNADINSFNAFEQNYINNQYTLCKNDAKIRNIIFDDCKEVYENAIEKVKQDRFEAEERREQRKKQREEQQRQEQKEIERWEQKQAIQEQERKEQANRYMEEQRRLRDQKNLVTAQDAMKNAHPVTQRKPSGAGLFAKSIDVITVPDRQVQSVMRRYEFKGFEDDKILIENRKERVFFIQNNNFVTSYNDLEQGEFFAVRRQNEPAWSQVTRLETLGRFKK